MPELLWSPKDQEVQKSQIARFIWQLKEKKYCSANDYSALQQWSIEQPEHFWQAFADFAAINFKQPATKIFQPGKHFWQARWFVGSTLNYAEHLLSRRDDHIAIYATDERGKTHQLTYQQLYQQVASLQAYMRSLGINKGDRVAGIVANIPEAIVAMLATASLGAVWSSCSPDFGIHGVLDRLSQIEPKLLIAVDGHFYKGKTFDDLAKVKTIIEALPSLQETLIISYSQNKPEISALKQAKLFNEVSNTAIANQTIDFTPCAFDEPLFILYSSGTTGKPKCMVHSVGGTLIQHLKEHRLHCDISEKDRFFFFTTCGWMMWNWLVSGLASGASLVLYDGSPFHPSDTSLIDLIDQFDISVFGVGAKYIEAIHKAGLSPKSSHRLNQLKSILTTGSPLLPESFDYLYQHFPASVRVSSISGGSDIISCFALGCPTLPVYRGEIQCRGLGMAVEVFNERGESVVGEKGELVCTQPFPSMPTGFWQDKNDTRYQAAYFERFNNVWAHGDYATVTPRGSMIIYGRSDATLNPSGVRIGTAEIYQQLEPFNDILDAVAVGQSWQGSERIVLFIILREGTVCDESFSKILKQHIRKNTSPHHVPAKIIAVTDIPRTLSGKIAEIAVKKLIHGDPIENQEALANPAAIAEFEALYQSGALNT